MSKAGNRISILLLVGLLPLASASLGAVERITGFSPGDTVTIRAAEAWEDEKPDIIHFNGDFQLEARDWYLSADQATLYGKLDDPETVVISGSPAQILLDTISKGQATIINGHAERIVYQRRSNSIRMEGNAFISRNGHSMSGGEIEYNIETDHLSAGGDGGVHIEVKPDKDGQKKSRG